MSHITTCHSPCSAGAADLATLREGLKLARQIAGASPLAQVGGWVVLRLPCAWVQYCKGKKACVKQHQLHVLHVGSGRGVGKAALFIPASTRACSIQHTHLLVQCTYCPAWLCKAHQRMPCPEQRNQAHLYLLPPYCLQYVLDEKYPGPRADSDAALEEFIRRTACSGNALVGTCK
jgi:hypothetical protein